MKRAVIILVCLLVIPMVFAPNDPGHDTLYIEENGDSLLTGTLNISDEFRVENLWYSSNLHLVGNGTILGAPSQPRLMGGSSQMYIDSTGALYLNTLGGTTSVIQMGDTSTNGVTLNVSGTIRQQNVLICLENGTNCPSGASETGNLTGSGAANQVTYWSSNTEVTGEGVFIYDPTTDSLGVGTGSPTAAFHGLRDDASYNSVTNVLILDHMTTNTSNSSDDIGTGILFRAEDQLAETENVAQISGVLSTNTNGSEAGAIAFFTRTGGGSLTERMRVGPTGNVGIATDNPQNELEVQGTLNATAIQVGTTAVCQSDGTNCPAGASDQNLFETVAADGQNLVADSATDTLNIGNSSGIGISASTATDSMTISINDDVITGTHLADTIVLDANLAITSADITIDSGTLMVDVSENNVGIGTTTPDVLLHAVGGSAMIENSNSLLILNDTDGPVYTIRNNDGQFEVVDLEAGTDVFTIEDSSLASTLVINNTGRVGIRVAQPSYGLDVLADGRFQSTSNPGLLIGDGSTGHIQIGGSTISDAAGDLTLDSDSGEISTLDELGIGTATPLTDIHVYEDGNTPTVGATTLGLFQRSASENAAISIIANQVGNASVLLGNETLGGKGGFAFDNARNTLYLIGGQVAQASITGTGMGLNTTTPTQELDVVGNINVSATGGCVYLPGGGRVCGNTTCTLIYSPNGNTVVQACN